MTDIPSPTMSVPSRLGVTAELDDGELTLVLHPRPETLHHGAIRASVVAYVIDAVAGLTVDGDPDVWTFTTDMSVRVRAVPAPPRILATNTIVRQGRRSVTCTVELTSGDGAPMATGAIGFAHVPRRDGDPPKPLVSPAEAPALFGDLGVLARPLREEAGVEVLDAAEGVAQLVVTPELCNPAGTLQGAMVALLAEAAAEDLVTTRFGAPAVVTDLDLRYLAKASEGPVRTRSRLLGTRPDAPVEIELVDISTGTTTTLVYARTVVGPVTRP